RVRLGAGVPKRHPVRQHSHRRRYANQTEILRTADGEVRQAELDPTKKLFPAAESDYRLRPDGGADDRKGAVIARTFGTMAGERPDQDAGRTALECFRAKRIPVRVKKTGQNKSWS